MSAVASARGRSSKRKGAGGELEAVKRINAHGWERATRNFGSGSQGNGDVAHGPAGVSIEIKRAERVQLRTWWQQCADDAGSDIPLLVVRWNHGPWLSVMELEEQLPLLRLRETA